MGKNFSLLLFLASMIGIEASVGLEFQLFCPPIGSMIIKKVGNQYEYSAKIEGWSFLEDRNIMMKNLYDKKLKLSSFSFVAASSSRDNRIFCTYTDPKGETLNLIASLKKGSTCTVTYPEGHEHPESSYFECKDNNLRSKPKCNV